MVTVVGIRYNVFMVAIACGGPVSNLLLVGVQSNSKRYIRPSGHIQIESIYIYIRYYVHTSIFAIIIIIVTLS